MIKLSHLRQYYLWESSKTNPFLKSFTSDYSCFYIDTNNFKKKVRGKYNLRDKFCHKSNAKIKNIRYNLERCDHKNSVPKSNILRPFCKLHHSEFDDTNKFDDFFF